MFWNDWYGWQRNLWDDLANLDTRFARPNYRRSYPGVQLYTQENDATIRAEVPGLEADDLSIEVQDDLVTIQMEKKAAEGEALRQERPAGKFEKLVRLPFRANQESVRAELKNGILTIHLERAAEDRPRKIAVAAR